MSRLNTGMELEGMEEINAELGRLHREAPELALDIAELGAEGIVSEAQQEDVAPYLTGFMSTQHGVERQDKSVVVFVNTGYAAASHANHPTKSGWLLRTLVGKGMDQIQRAAKVIFDRQESQSAPRSGGAS